MCSRLHLTHDHRHLAHDHRRRDRPGRRPDASRCGLADLAEVEAEVEHRGAVGQRAHGEVVDAGRRYLRSAREVQAATGLGPHTGRAGQGDGVTCRRQVEVVQQDELTPAATASRTWSRVSHSTSSWMSAE